MLYWVLGSPYMVEVPHSLFEWKHRGSLCCVNKCGHTDFIIWSTWRKRWHTRIDNFCWLTWRTYRRTDNIVVMHNWPWKIIREIRMCCFTRYFNLLFYQLIFLRRSWVRILGQKRVITKDVKNSTQCCYFRCAAFMVWVGEMSYPKIGSTHY